MKMRPVIKIKKQPEHRQFRLRGERALVIFAPGEIFSGSASKGLFNVSLIAHLRRQVAMRLGQCRQFIVSRLFFSEDFIEQTGGVLVFKLLCPFTQAAIRGDFIVLCLLPRFDECWRKVG
jgi:hypothetical protein